MNSKKAKALRKEIYGDNSQRVSERRYSLVRGVGSRKRARTVINAPGTPRSVYQLAKRVL